MIPFPSNPEALLADLTDPHLSLHAVAAKHNTTLPALILWMSAAANAARLDSYREACAAHARLVATSMLPNCVTGLDAIARAHLADATATADPQVGNANPTASDQPAVTPTLGLLRYRRLEAARRALSTILRVARWQDPRPTAAITRADATLPVASTSSQCREPKRSSGSVLNTGEVSSRSPAALDALHELLRCLPSSEGAGDETGVSPVQPAFHSASSTPAHADRERQTARAESSSDTHVSPTTLPPSRITDHPPPNPCPPSFASFAPLSRPSHSKSRAPASLLTRAGTTSRLSRAGPSLQTA
ncbi:MAG: hypothetical protein KF768_00150 [Phycisphaeraceae bacterium]|nr:hypothetical protein [Phycisphaeraceae bacterium]